MKDLCIEEDIMLDIDLMININKMKYRLPRKLKKKIPKGMYCYTPISYEVSTGVFHIKPCQFYCHIKIKDKPEELQDELDKEYPDQIIGWCKRLKMEIEDQCKWC